MLSLTLDQLKTESGHCRYRLEIQTCQNIDMEEGTFRILCQCSVFKEARLKYLEHPSMHI